MEYTRLTQVLLDTYKIPNNEDKRNATHHDEFFSYYNVPIEQQLELAIRLIHCWEMGYPLTLSEHPKTTPRLYMDLDTNKHSHSLQVTDAMVHQFAKKVAEEAKNAFNSRKIYDVSTSVKNDRLFGFLPPSIVDSPFFDKFSIIILKSKISQTPLGTLGTYHLIFPCMAGTQQQQEDFWRGILETMWIELYDGIKDAMDFNVLSARKLRGLFCDKLTDTTPRTPLGRPFEFNAVVGLTHEPQTTLVGPVWNFSNSMNLWKATTLLLDASNIQFALAIYGPATLSNATRRPRPHINILDAASSQPSTPQQHPPQPPPSPSQGLPSSEAMANLNAFLSTTTTLLHEHAIERERQDDAMDPVEVRRIQDAHLTSSVSTPTLSQEREAFQSTDSLHWQGYDPVEMANVIAKAKDSLIPSVHQTKEAAIEEIQEKLTTYLNQFFCFVPSTNGQYMMKTWESKKRLPTYVFFTRKGLKELLSAGGDYRLKWPENSKGGPSLLKAFELWTTSPRRLWFSSIVFTEKSAPEELNLWQGFELTPSACREYRGYSTTGALTRKEFNVNTILGHIYTWFCDGNVKLFYWFVSWMASILKTPFTKLGTVPVIISDEGAGKDLIINRSFKEIMGNMYFTTSQVDDIVGRFNGVLTNKILLIYNEGSVIKEKKEGILKSLVTDTAMRSESKFMDTKLVENHCNLMVLANPPHSGDPLIKISSKNRRWVFFNSNSANNNNLNYFKDLFDWLGYDGDLCGVKAWGDYLYNLNLNAERLRDIPHTEMNSAAKEDIMETIHKWWKDCLEKREVNVTTLVDNENYSIHHLNDQWNINEGAEVSIEKLLDSFKIWKLTDHLQEKTPSRTDFNLSLKKVGLKMKRIHDGNNRTWVFTVKPADLCITDFQNAYGGGITIGEDDTHRPRQSLMDGAVFPDALPLPDMTNIEPHF